MARLARVVIAGHRHHVTQGGNGRARTFFSEADYALYRDLLGEHCRAAGVAVWAWRLMPNHTHLALVPSDDDGLRRALAPCTGATPASSTRAAAVPAISGRDGSVAVVMTRSIFWPRSPMWRPIRCAPAWSDARAPGAGQARARIPDFAAFLAGAEDGEAFARLRAAGSIGRPLGDERFMARLERLTRRRLRPGKRGPTPKQRQLGNAP